MEPLFDFRQALIQIESLDLTARKGGLLEPTFNRRNFFADSLGGGTFCRAGAHTVGDRIEVLSREIGNRRPGHQTRQAGESAGSG